MSVKNVSSPPVSPALIQPEDEQAEGKLDSLESRDAQEQRVATSRGTPSPSQREDHNTLFAKRAAGSNDDNLPKEQERPPQSETRSKFVPLPVQQKVQQTAQPNLEEAVATLAGEDQLGRSVVNPSSDEDKLHKLPRLTRFKNAVLNLFGLKNFFSGVATKFRNFRARKARSAQSRTRVTNTPLPKSLYLGNAEKLHKQYKNYTSEGFTTIFNAGNAVFPYVKDQDKMEFAARRSNAQAILLRYNKGQLIDVSDDETKLEEALQGMKDVLDNVVKCKKEAATHPTSRPRRRSI